MSLLFRYTLRQSQRQVVSLGGRWVRPRPLIAVRLIGPAGDHFEDGLLDTGSDDTVFHGSIAAKVGLDLTGAPAGEASGIGAGATPLRYARVMLRLVTAAERREWPAWVGFTATPLRRPLLGFAGLLQFFTANFRGDREEVELNVNPLYPGT